MCSMLFIHAGQHYPRHICNSSVRFKEGHPHQWIMSPSARHAHGNEAQVKTEDIVAV